jgi:ParB-like chromosome segregation protein Spo0J
MSAVHTGAAGHHQYIPLQKLQPSPLNHRKHFDKTKMEELTAT